MDRKEKYRMLILVSLVILLMFLLGWVGYWYMDRRAVKEIPVQDDQDVLVQNISGMPYFISTDAVTVSADSSGTQAFVSDTSMRTTNRAQIKETGGTEPGRKSVYVSGSAVGIYMETDGVLIVDTGEILSEEGNKEEPARNLVQPGDYIVAFNNQSVSTKRELMDDLTQLDGEKVTLEVVREGKSVPVSLTPVKDRCGNYKLGIWVRDDTQGIGTLTYVDDKGNYGALGHGISDVDTGELLNIGKGALYQAEILSIQKGTSGTPGELAGLIRYEPSRILGTISSNSENGIYGQLTGDTENLALKRMEVAHKQEIKEGPATVLCCTDGSVKEYDAEITRIDRNHEDTNKSFVIHVTDPELLNETGGIVRGLSGSPVIQNGRFAGAVTHVFVQDASSGYGIFAETMLKQA